MDEEHLEEMSMSDEDFEFFIGSQLEIIDAILSEKEVDILDLRERTEGLGALEALVQG